MTSLANLVDPTCTEGVQAEHWEGGGLDRQFAAEIVHYLLVQLALYSTDSHSGDYKVSNIENADGLRSLCLSQKVKESTFYMLLSYGFRGGIDINHKQVDGLISRKLFRTIELKAYWN